MGSTADALCPRGLQQLPDEFDVLLVGLHPLRLALRLHEVETVVPLAQLSPLPEAPPFVSGTLNLHGRALPVVDLRARLFGQQVEAPLSSVIVVVSSPLGGVGLLLDEALVVRRIARKEIQHAVRETAVADYVLGSVTIDSSNVLLLSVAPLLQQSGVARELST